jgi:hypothetical protein
MMSLCRPGIILLFFLSILHIPVAGQTGDRQQSDTAVSDTVVVGSEEGRAGVVQNDSVYETSADTSGVSADSLLARTVADSLVGAWKKAPAFSYANDPRYWKRVPEKDDSAPWVMRLLSSKAFQYGFYLILGALLVYAIGRIVSENQLGIFYRRGAKRSVGGDDQPAEEFMEKQDVERGLQRSLDNGDFREAIRYSYLRSLRQLDERGLIRYHGRATNQEYVRQLNGTAQEASFRFLTQAYEKVWYGQFGLSEETFRRLFGYFMEFDKTVQG